MKLQNKNPALILIDMQTAFDDEEYWGGNRNNKDAEKKSQQILFKWRELKLPIFHIKHSSQNPNSKLHKSNIGFEIKDEVKPIHGETVITKKVNSAFIGTDLEARLNKLGITTLVIIGFITNHCVSTTARMAGNFGYETIVISDATATFDRIGINGEKYSSEIIHLTSLANLKEEFAEIIDTEQLINLL
ncbi:MAG: cysteine hydrolase family protein [Melioribacteraceae bacterium]